MTTYQIVRFYRDHGPEILESGVSLEEAKEYCNDPETSSATATGYEAQRLTQVKGPWFCGWREE